MSKQQRAICARNKGTVGAQPRDEQPRATKTAQGWQQHKQMESVVPTLSRVSSSAWLYVRRAGCSAPITAAASRATPKLAARLRRLLARFSVLCESGGEQRTWSRSHA